MSKYDSLKHAKFKIRYHLIFSTKYRRKLLIDDKIRKVLYSYMLSALTDNFKIDTMETDKDHIHLLVHATPNVTPYEIVHALKQKSTYMMWHNFNSYMNKWYWSGKHYLWTRGYFCSTIGDVSEQKLRHYIEHQG